MFLVFILMRLNLIIKFMFYFFLVQVGFDDVLDFFYIGTERQKDRKRQRDIETERQRDRERERQTEKEGETINFLRHCVWMHFTM